MCVQVHFSVLLQKQKSETNKCLQIEIGRTK